MSDIKTNTEYATDCVNDWIVGVNESLYKTYLSSHSRVFAKYGDTAIARRAFKWRLHSRLIASLSGYWRYRNASVDDCTRSFHACFVGLYNDLKDGIENRRIDYIIRHYVNTDVLFEAWKE